MSDNKNDDFWKSSGTDDFWNKKVVDDDWLKEDDSNFWDSRDESPKQTDYSGLSKEFYTDTAAYGQSKKQKRQSKMQPARQPKPDKDAQFQPYMQSTPQPVRQQSSQGSSQPYMQSAPQPYQEAAQTGTQAERPKRKPLHIHTIICLISIFVAALCVVSCMLMIKMRREAALKAALNLSYEEVEVEDSFFYNENNQVYLDKDAYTVVTDSSFQGFPGDAKLIAVHAGVTSEKYIKNGYALKDIYIGFDGEDGDEYRKPLTVRQIGAYTKGVGFDNEVILSSYGIGNGMDEEGYYFFYVPASVKEITLYMERKKDAVVPVIDRMYTKYMKVLPEDKDLTEQLTQTE